VGEAKADQNRNLREEEEVCWGPQPQHREGRRGCGGEREVGGVGGGLERGKAGEEKEVGEGRGNGEVGGGREGGASGGGGGGGGKGVEWKRREK